MVFGLAFYGLCHGLWGCETCTGSDGLVGFNGECAVLVPVFLGREMG